MAEKRAFQRLPSNFRVEISRLGFPQSKMPRLEIESMDVGGGGLLLQSPERFEPGDNLMLRLYISGLNKFHPGFFKVFESDVGQYLQAIAEVVRAESVPGGYALGIRFTDVDADDAKALRDFIASRLKSEG
jgi:hypothetical protein